MTKRILVDALHPEEIRVAVADDSKLLEFDFESVEKKQIKSNIYLGKITRVEPSLQAAFVEYGGHRQGFLPFSEIHYDYFQIPIEDKEKLQKTVEAERKKQELNQEQDTENGNERAEPAQERRYRKDSRTNNNQQEAEFVIPTPFTKSDLSDLLRAENLAKQFALEIMGEEYYNEKFLKPSEEISPETEQNIAQPEPESESDERTLTRMEFYKQYKIQEVIKRNQIVLIQIVKEERGTKGASLTTYLALAGRYCVFMPNTDKGGGVSRRISNYSERRRIRDIIRQLNTPAGTSVIIRTAGMERETEDIKKDYEYLLSLWDNIRKQTLESSAPSLIYEESDIVKRSLRDMLKGDVTEVYIEGEETYKSAKRFMEIIGSTQIEMIKNYIGKVPIFQKFKIEEKLDELYEPEIKLNSGGSIVITPTEALVSIDVNSGKATKERSVEDTALKTNIEAAWEIARQLKLRDLAGLVVIDFIDMREVRNRKNVERELKDALKSDKAKIQIGRISAFGLLEMSRQRLRSSIVESSSGRCPMCSGFGVVRTNESLTLKAIRAIEAEAGKKAVKEIFLRASQAIAHNIEGHRKREIEAIENNDGVKIIIEVDTSLLPNQFEISAHKFSSSGGKTKPAKHKQSEAGSSNERPQQEIVKTTSDLPSEKDIDADVDEQLSAWQSEVADIEKMQNRRYDKTETSENEHGKKSGGYRNNDRSGYRGRNQKGKGGRNNRRKNNGRRYKNFDDRQGYPQNNYVSSREMDNVERIDPYQEHVSQMQKNSESYEKQPEATRNTDDEKIVSSKLIGLWKKITS